MRPDPVNVASPEDVSPDARAPDAFPGGALGEASGAPVWPGRRLARLVLVISLFPGAALTMLLAPALKSPGLLLAGLLLLAGALLGHRRLTTALLTLSAGAGAARSNPCLENP